MNSRWLIRAKRLAQNPPSWGRVKLVIAVICACAALWGYEQWRWFNTLQADKTHAELALLKSQINPHFFFNTLNNLYGLVVEKSDQAPEVILKLSDMMRYIIYCLLYTSPSPRDS